MARTAVPADATCSSRRRPRILPAWVDRAARARDRVGRRHRSLPARRGRRRRRSHGPARACCACSRAPFARGTAPIHLSAALARLHAAGDDRFGGVFIGDGPSARPPSARPRGVPARAVHRARRRTTGCRRRSRPPTSAWRRSIPARHAPLQLGFYWSPLKIFEYMARPAGRRAGAAAAAPARRARARGRAVRSGRSARPRSRHRRWPIRAARAARRGGARARRARVQLGTRTAARSTRGCRRSSSA